MNPQLTTYAKANSLKLLILLLLLFVIYRQSIMADDLNELKVDVTQTSLDIDIIKSQLHVVEQPTPYKL